MVLQLMSLNLKFYKRPIEIEHNPLTTTMWFMYVDCRMHMGFEATEKTVIFLTGHLLEGKVPEKEYALLWEAC